MELQELTEIVFDIAIRSLDFNSGFLEDDEVEALRELAVLLGVDPWEATPSQWRPRYCPGHTFGEWKERFVTDGYMWLERYHKCEVCELYVYERKKEHTPWSTATIRTYP
jgi:hypothetical protein